ncbi:MAG: hypothetical protein ACM3UN_03855 [Bacillota bacterium]
MSFDLTIIAIVFTLILLLVFFSAVVLYLAFRVKETFRKETRRGANIAKTAFLIGTLFLAGGIMYFSATTIANMQQPNQTTTNTPSPTVTFSPTETPSTSGYTPQPTIAPSISASPTPASSLQPNPTPTLAPTSPTPTPNTAPVSFSVFFNPSPATKTTPETMTLSIINPSTNTLQNAAIQTRTLFSFFTTTDSRVNTNAGTINLGSLPPGTTAFTIQLQATSVGQVDDSLSLVYQGLQNQITQQISIRITGK